MPTQATSSAAPLPAEWADAVRSILEADGVPGAAVSVVHPDGTFEMMHGTVNITSGAPVERTTGFQLCSLSKAYIATLALVLEQAGVLSLDDLVTSVVPEFAPEPAWLRDEVRFRDLLSNRLAVRRGGLSDYGLAKHYDYAELARRMSHMPRSGQFRAQYSYCNPGFGVVVLALERLTGSSYASLLRQHVLDPAGLAQTSMGPEAQASTDRARPHTIDRQGRLAAVGVEDDDDWSRPGAGGIMSTAHDQQRWLRLNLGRGQLDDEQVLPRSIWDQLWQPHIALTPSQRELSVGDPGAFFAAYGLGWFLSTYHGRPVVSHTGGGSGWRTRSVLLPEQDIGVSVLLNVDGKTGTAIQHTLLELCLDLPRRPWLDIVRADQANKHQASEAELEAEFPRSDELPWDPTRVAGRFSNAQSGQVEVRSAQDGLELRFIDGPTWNGALRPLGGAAFLHDVHGPMATYDGPNAPAQRVRFEESDGAVSTLVHSYIGSFERC